MTNHNIPSGETRIAPASGAGGIGSSVVYDLADVTPIEKSALFATTFEEAKIIMKNQGVVAYYPIDCTNTFELEQFHTNLAGMAGLMTRLTDKKSKGNRGKDRHCLNDFSDSLFKEESYELLREVLRPGRCTLHLLEELFPGSSYDTGIGDYVKAKAPGSSATMWHQDWHLEGHVICVSILTDEVDDENAPMMIGFGSTVIKCTGGKGLVVMRDVAKWHKGSMHTGSKDRIMPSYRFATTAAQKLGFGIKKSLNHRTTAKFPPIIRVFLEKRTRGPTPFSMAVWSDDHNQADVITTPPVASTWGQRVCSVASTWGQRICSAFLRVVPCLFCNEMKKGDKKPVDDKKPPVEEFHLSERPSSMYSLSS
jgi:hypothetical protein